MNTSSSNTNHSRTEILVTIPELPDRNPKKIHNFYTDDLNFIIEKSRLKYIVTPEMKQCIGYCTKNKIILHPTKKIYYAALNDCPVDPSNNKNKEGKESKKNPILSSDNENKIKRMNEDYNDSDDNDNDDNNNGNTSSNIYNINEAMEKKVKLMNVISQRYSLCRDNDYYVNNSGRGFIDIVPDIVIKTNELLDIYGITSYNKGLEYIKYNTTDNLRTKLRIIDCLWKVYSNNINNVTDIFIEFFTIVAKKLWAPELYKKFYIYIVVEIVDGEETNNLKDNKKKSKYVGVSQIFDDDKIIYIKKNNQNFSYYKKEKINFFVTKFINQSRMYEFLKIYLQTYQNSMNDRNIEYLYMKSMRSTFSKFVKSKIMYMLD